MNSAVYLKVVELIELIIELIELIGRVQNSVKLTVILKNSILYKYRTNIHKF